MLRSAFAGEAGRASGSGARSGVAWRSKSLLGAGIHQKKLRSWGIRPETTRPETIKPESCKQASGASRRSPTTRVGLCSNRNTAASIRCLASERQSSINRQLNRYAFAVNAGSRSDRRHHKPKHGPPGHWEAFTPTNAERFQGRSPVMLATKALHGSLIERGHQANGIGVWNGALDGDGFVAS